MKDRDVDEERSGLSSVCVRERDRERARERGSERARERESEVYAKRDVNVKRCRGRCWVEQGVVALCTRQKYLHRKYYFL